MCFRRFLVILSAGVIVGTALGLVFSFVDIVENQDLPYGMIRTVILKVRDGVTIWSLKVSGLSAAFFVLFLFSRAIWKRIGSQAPDDHGQGPENRPGLIKVGLTFLVLIGILNAYVFIDNRFRNSRKPNVIIVYLDTLRYDHLGCYGYHRDTSPNIDLLAGSGVRVENAFAQAPCTYPSVHSTMTSKYASHFNLDGNVILDKRHLTLAEILKNEGYYTVAFSSSPIIKQSKSFISKGGFGQGFDIFDESVLSGEEWNWQWRSPEGVVEGALRWLDENYEREFFLFLYIMDPHCNYDCPEPYKNRYVLDYDGKENVRDGNPGAYEVKILRGIDTDLDDEDIQHFIDLYDAEIRYSDAQVGRLLDRLEQLDLVDRSLVIFLSDHGEEFFEHQGLKHCYTLYNELIKVPLILKFPPIILPGAVIDEELIQLIDLVPTILDIVDIDKPRSLQGDSFLPLITNESKEWRDYAVSEAPFVDAKAIIEGQFKYIHHFETEPLMRDLCDKYGKGKELYNLERDPTETVNIYDDKVEFAESLYVKMMDLLPDFERRRLMGRVDIEIDRESEEQLKSLGYLR